MNREKTDPKLLATIVKMMSMEHNDRCLSPYKVKEKDHHPTRPFTAFFTDQEKQEYMPDLKIPMIGSEKSLLEDFCALESVQKAAKMVVRKNFKEMIATIPVALNSSSSSSYILVQEKCRGLPCVLLLGKWV